MRANIQPTITLVFLDPPRPSRYEIISAAIVALYAAAEAEKRHRATRQNSETGACLRVMPAKRAIARLA